MKKPFMLLILFVIMPFFMLMPFASSDWFYNSQNIIASIDIYSDAEIIKTSPGGYIQSAAVNMTFFPKRTFTQELLKFYTSPEAELAGAQLKFRWEKPDSKIGFRLNANVKTINDVTKIKEKINFPILKLPGEAVAYTKPSKTIDSDNEEIIRVASELVKGEDDLYSAVFKIADWTKNSISYNLSTLTAEVSQKASWVLQNRQGVCDELTSLFIALLRAVGIPAKFVSGIAYTDSELFLEKWGPHGWAEVYFPNYGWVPYDVTYGEFGWIDPTHIKFKESIDSDEPSTFYQWLGRNAELRTRKLDIKTELMDKIGGVIVPLNIETVSLKKAVNFGSYNLVEAFIENPNDFYYATELNLNKPKEVKIFGNRQKSILLLPKEKKKLFWILKVDEDLGIGYSYTFPLVVSTLSNISSETMFESNSREKHVSFEEIQQIAKLLEEEKEKKYSGNVLLDCKTEKNEFYEYETAQIYCDAKNIGSIFLDNVDVCFEGKCSKISLGISQNKNVTFEINSSKIGVRESPVVLRNELVSKIFNINLKVNDAPKIEVENLSFPINVSYDSNFNVAFTIMKKSYSNPKDVEVIFALNGVEKKWNINELEHSRDFAVKFTGDQLKYGANNFKIHITYYDGLKKQYKYSKEFSTELTNANLLQIMALSLNSLAGISTEAIAIMLLTGTIAFILVVLWLFRQRKSHLF